MSIRAYVKPEVKVADELFIIVALLHREQPQRRSFAIPEILERAKKEGLGEHRADQRSLKQHAYEHAAANIPPGNGKYRMVYREKDNTIRLLRTGDFIDSRRNGKFWPSENDVPERYAELIAWAQAWSRNEKQEGRWLGDLLKLRGLGKEIWQGTNPEKYVSELRKGWQ